MRLKLQSVLIALLLCLSFTGICAQDFLNPINAEDRTDIAFIELTPIGKFGEWRKDREYIKGHFHTGIDIKRPNDNYTDAEIYPIFEGKVISVSDDGSYDQIIIALDYDFKFWTVYEHVAGIKVEVKQHVNPEKPMASFMNKGELDKHGWQFDHLHFEILRVPPLGVDPDRKRPERFFISYSLLCYSKNDLDRYFYDPIRFF